LRPESEIRAKIRECDEMLEHADLKNESNIILGLNEYRAALIWALDKPIPKKEQ